MLLARLSGVFRLSLLSIYASASVVPTSFHFQTSLQFPFDREKKVLQKPYQHTSLILLVDIHECRSSMSRSGKQGLWKLPEIKSPEWGKLGPAFGYGLGCGFGVGAGLVGGRLNTHLQKTGNS